MTATLTADDGTKWQVEIRTIKADKIIATTRDYSKPWSFAHAQLDMIEDRIHSLHGGIKSPALETLDKLRLKIIEEEK